MREKDEMIADKIFMFLRSPSEEPSFRPENDSICVCFILDFLSRIPQKEWRTGFTIESNKLLVGNKKA